MNRISFLHRQMLRIQKKKKAEEKLNQSPPPIEKITEIVCYHYELDPEEVRGPSRKKEIALARHMIMFLPKYDRIHSKPTLKEIGEKLGGRDHTTVLHSINTMWDLLETDPQIRRAVADIHQEALGRPFTMTNRYQ